MWARIGAHAHHTSARARAPQRDAARAGDAARQRCAARRHPQKHAGTIPPHARVAPLCLRQTRTRLHSLSHTRYTEQYCKLPLPIYSAPPARKKIWPAHKISRGRPPPGHKRAAHRGARERSAASLPPTDARRSARGEPREGPFAAASRTGAPFVALREWARAPVRFSAHGHWPRNFLGNFGMRRE